MELGLGLGPRLWDKASAKFGGWAARPTLSRRGMLSPLLELYFAKSNAVSPLCVERREGGGCGR